MIFKNSKYYILFILICFITGCSIQEKSYVIPVNYSGEASVKVYTDKSENTYDVKVTCRDGNYSFNISNDSVNWDILINGETCILKNNKLKDCESTINNFKIGDLMLTEFDFSKFIDTEGPIPKELIYWDGTYKHVLNFSKENLLPKNIFIYKNDKLVKTIYYNKLNAE